MILTGETPIIKKELSGGRAILSLIGISLFALLLSVGAKEYVEYRMEKRDKPSPPKDDHDS